jgi:hypothetical protein
MPLFTVKLNGRTYEVDRVPVRVVRKMGPVQEVYNRLINEPENIDVEKDIDTIVKWFVEYCGNQFTADDIYDHYPGDKIITDVGLAIMSINLGVDRVLKDVKSFPTGDENAKKKQEARTILSKGFIGTFWKKAFPKAK